MKGGNANRGRGKHFSVTLLLVVVCMTVFLWSYERRPLSTTFFSSQDQLLLPRSDDIQVGSHISEEFGKSDDHPVQESPPVLQEPKDITEVHASKDENAEETEDRRKPYISKDDNAEETQDPRKQYSSNVKSTSEAVPDDSPETVEDEMGSTSSEKKVCNYAKGRWIVDNMRPLYSGFKCKQWLSEMWACRLTQRPDFGYEAYRWQPKDCDMPEFERSSFLKRMRHKTIAFVGDSLGRQQFQSLMCMATGGEELQIEDVAKYYGLATPHGAARPDGWAFRFPVTNTTILYYWSSCLCDLEPLNIKDPQTQVAMHLDRPPSFLKRFLHRFDVVILNTGHHWNRGKVNANRWVMYVDGKPNEDQKLARMDNAKNFTIHMVSKWLDAQLPSHPRLKAFFRTISPRHFFNGEWNTGGSCENTTPLARGSEVDLEESSDPVIASAVRGTRLKLLDITALSQLRDEGHISRYSIKASAGVQDCLHWCLPGIPDTWNEILATQI